MVLVPQDRLEEGLICQGTEASEVKGGGRSIPPTQQPGGGQPGGGAYLPQRYPRTSKGRHIEAGQQVLHGKRWRGNAWAAPRS